LQNIKFETLRKEFHEDCFRTLEDVFEMTLDNSYKISDTVLTGKDYMIFIDTVLNKLNTDKLQTINLVPLMSEHCRDNAIEDSIDIILKPERQNLIEKLLPLSENDLEKHLDKI